MLGSVQPSPVCPDSQGWLAVVANDEPVYLTPTAAQPAAPARPRLP
jgi:hypothetical protein